MCSVRVISYAASCNWTRNNEQHNSTNSIIHSTFKIQSGISKRYYHTVPLFNNQESSDVLLQSGISKGVIILHLISLIKNLQMFCYQNMKKCQHYTIQNQLSYMHLCLRKMHIFSIHFLNIIRKIHRNFRKKIKPANNYLFR